MRTGACTPEVGIRLGAVLLTVSVLPETRFNCENPSLTSSLKQNVTVLDTTTESSAVPLFTNSTLRILQIGFFFLQQHHNKLWSDLHRNVGQEAIETEDLGKVSGGERFCVFNVAFRHV